MKKNFEIKKEWEKTKKQMQKLSEEAIVLARKGEKEMVKFSQKGKLHLDSTALNLKVEHLYYLIGKEYVTSRRTNKPSVQLDKLVEEIKKLEKEQRSVKGKISRAGKKKKTTKKKATKRK